MGIRHVARVLLVVTLLVCAGCASPVADSAPEPDGSDSALEGPSEPGEVTNSETNESSGDSETNETNGDSEERDRDDGDADPDEPTTRAEAETTAEADEILPVDVNGTYDRVSELLESEADQPQVQVRDMNELLADTYDERQDPFHETMNMTETEVDTESARGLASGGTVVVDPNDGTRADVEQVLVHEYVHAIQFAERWIPNPRLDADVATSTDYRNVETALIEGGAVWVTDQYSAVYQDDDVRLQSERLATEYETAPDGDRYFRAPYHYGVQYADERLEEPTDFPALYEEPPTTSEQLIHGHDADEVEPTELAIDLSVESDSGTEASGADSWVHHRDDRLGELFTRVALETELERGAAADAAAGWGNDRLVGFHDEDDLGYVWVLHWDSPDDADAFETAFETVLAERTDDWADLSVVDRHGEETVVVTVGPERFHEATTVVGSETDSGAEVDVELDVQTDDE